MSVLSVSVFQNFLYWLKMNEFAGVHDKVYNEITDESTCFQIVKGHADCIYNTNARNFLYRLTVTECAVFFL